MKIKPFITIVITVALLLMLGLTRAEDFNPDAPQESGSTTNYDQMTPYQKVQYLQENYGITITENNIGNIAINGNRIIVGGGTFKLNGAEFSKGSVEITNGKITEASSVETTGFKHEGAQIDGTFSLSGSTLALEHGTAKLGSDTSPLLKIKAGTGTSVDVTGGSGYTGTIHSSESYVLTLKDKTASLTGDAEIEHGKIKEAKKAEIKDPAHDVFTAVPPQVGVTMDAGQVSRGDTLTSSKVCADFSCLIVPEGQEGQAVFDPLGITYSSPGEVTYTTDGRVDKTFETPQAVTFKTDGSCELSGGTRFTELQDGTPIFTVRTSEGTVYLPPSEKPPEISTIFDLALGNNVPGSPIPADFVKAAQKGESYVDPNGEEYKYFYPGEGLGFFLSQEGNMYHSRDDGIFYQSTLTGIETSYSENRVEASFKTIEGKTYSTLFDVLNMKEGSPTSADFVRATQKGETLIGPDGQRYKYIYPGKGLGYIVSTYGDEMYDIRDDGTFYPVKQVPQEVEKNLFGEGTTLKVKKTEFISSSPSSYSCPPDTSCVSYDNSRKMAIQTEGAGQTEVDYFGQDPSLQVTLNPNGQSVATFNAHDTAQEGDGITQFQATGQEMTVYPAGGLPDFLKGPETATDMSIPGESVTYQTEDGRTIVITIGKVTVSDAPEGLAGEVEDVFGQSSVIESYGDNGYSDPSTATDLTLPTSEPAVFGEQPDQRHQRQLQEMYAAGTIGQSTAMVLSQMQVNLNDPTIKAKILELNRVAGSGDNPELESRAATLSHLHKRYGSNDPTQRDGDTLDDLIAVSQGKVDKVGARLTLPSQLTSDKIPEFLEAARRIKDAGIYSDNTEDVGVEIELYEKGVSDNLGDKKVSAYFVHGSSRDDHQSGIKVLQTMQEAADDPSFSPAARDALRGSLQATGRTAIAGELNYLHDQDATQRKALADSLPPDVTLGVMSVSVSRLGYGFYRSSEGLVYQHLIDQAGGKDKVISYMEERGYTLKDEKGRGVVAMLAAAGQLPQVLPKDPSKRQELYQVVLTSIDTSSDAFETSRTLLNNPNTRKEYSKTLLEEYQKVQDPKTPENMARKDLLQYTIRLNGDDFDQNDPMVKDAVDHPSPRVVEQERKLKLPVQQWVDQSPKDDGVPVLSSLVYFTSTEDPNEMGIYHGFSGVGGFTVKERLPGDKGYILEKRGTLDGRPVIYRVTVTNNHGVVADTRTSTPLFAEFSRGHSYDTGKAWDNLPANQPGQMPKFGFVGSCSGATSISGGDLTEKQEGTAFFATAGVGRGGLNNVYFSSFYRAIEGCKDYLCVESKMKAAGGGGEDASNYAGPAKFAALAFQPKYYTGTQVAQAPAKTPTSPS